MNRSFSILLPLLFLVTIIISTGYAQTQSAEPDPSRFEQEISAFEEWDAKNSAPEQAVLFVGSSSIRFWNTARAFPEYSVINRGFGGSHISDVLHYYDRVIGRFNPSLIVFYCGENDIYSDLALEKVFGDYIRLLDQIFDDFSEVRFLYASIKPSNSRLQHSEAFTAFNRMVEEHNRSDERLHYIDLASPLTKEGKPDDSFFVDDQLHLNERGYRVWSRLLYDFLDEMHETGVLSKREVLTGQE